MYEGSTYPLRTPSTKLSIKKDPRMMRGIKYIQLKLLPSASFVCNKETQMLANFNVETAALTSIEGGQSRPQTQNPKRPAERSISFQTTTLHVDSSEKNNVRKEKRSYVVQNVGPAFHGDALEDGEHGIDDVVEAGDTIVWTLPIGSTVRALWARVSSGSLLNVKRTWCHLVLPSIVKFPWKMQRYQRMHQLEETKPQVD